VNRAAGKTPFETGELPPLDIICFANDWNSDPLSKKQIMTRLARRHRILWVNSINNRQPRLARKDLSRVFQKLREFRSGLQQVEEQIWVLTPLYLPFHRHAAFRRLNRMLLGWQIRRASRRLGFGKPISWSYVPTSADVVGTLGEKFILYQCVDEYAAFSDAAGEVRAREQDLLAKSDLVLVCSLPLLESKRKANPRTHLVTHGVDYEHFRRATNPTLEIAAELRALPRPILGFHGLIADWVDLHLMADIARLRPEWSIVLVGRTDADVSPLKGLPNVHMMGHRPYARLPEYLRGFDVALLPFVNNELTISANPLKLREYLAAGLPVVAAPLPEIARLGDLVALAGTAEEYVDRISNLLLAGDVGPSLQRSERVRNESWDYKVLEMENLLATALANSSSGSKCRQETAERRAVVEIGGSKTG
jgi:glycosyltransferase involved in cell wall biosynthesis